MRLIYYLNFFFILTFPTNLMGYQGGCRTESGTKIISDQINRRKRIWWTYDHVILVVPCSFWKSSQPHCDHNFSRISFIYIYIGKNSIITTLLRLLQCKIIMDRRRYLPWICRDTCPCIFNGSFESLAAFGEEFFNIQGLKPNALCLDAHDSSWT